MLYWLIGIIVGGFLVMLLGVIFLIWVYSLPFKG